jgi:hypothetical protein
MTWKLVLPQFALAPLALVASTLAVAAPPAAACRLLSTFNFQHVSPVISSAAACDFCGIFDILVCFGAFTVKCNLHFVSNTVHCAIEVFCVDKWTAVRSDGPSTASPRGINRPTNA